MWAVASIMIISSGLFFSYKLKFIQFNIVDMFRCLFVKSNSGVYLYKSLLMVLGGRIGVGSIAGISLAIYLGGVGVVFWILICGIFFAINTFCETVLGNVFQRKDKNMYLGGPSYYLMDGLGSKFLSYSYAFIMLFTYIVGFISIQSNTISVAIVSKFYIDRYVIGIFICMFSFLVINGGIVKIMKVTNILVPIMMLIYIFISSYILIINYDVLFDLFVTIFKEAFNFKSLGFGLIGVMVLGVQRGIFCTESGLGTSSIAASTLKVPCSAMQGFVQMFGTYLTTILICISTALIVMLSDFGIVEVTNGIELTQFAFSYHLGYFGEYTLLSLIILFAFSTILSGYYDGESNFKFLFGDKYVFILKFFTVLVLFLGSVISATFIWSFLNIFTAIMAIINIYSLFKLRGIIFFELNKYKKRV